MQEVLWTALHATLPKEVFPVNDKSDDRLFIPDEAPESLKKILDLWNYVLDSMDNLLDGDTLADRAIPTDYAKELGAEISQALFQDHKLQEANPLASDQKWAAEHPESFDKDGHAYFRYDIELLDVAEGQEFRKILHNGVEYHTIVGQPVGKAKGKKARGKTAVRDPTPPPREASKDSSLPGGVKLEGPSSQSVPLIAQENPLRVKGEPKSKALSEGQRKSLREFFHLETQPVAPEVWANLTNRDRSAEMAKRSIPRWASEAVLRSPSNLQLVLEGKITKDNAQSAPRSLKVGITKVSAEAMEAWQGLKSDFKGTPLLQSPQSSKEKAFRKRFDSMVEKYGKQSCFPKLKARPDQQGRGQASRSGSRNRGGSSDLLDTLRLVGEVARAFAGK